MLTSLHVQNFKCLRDVKVEFGPLTVLIGPNGSGKSSILDSLRLLGRTAVEPLADVFKGPDEWRHLVWKGKEKGPISCLVGMTAGQGEDAYSLQVDARRVIERVKLEAGDSEGENEVEGITCLNERLMDLLQPPGVATMVVDPPGAYFASFAEQHRGDIFALSRAPRYRLNPEHLREAAVPTPEAVLAATGENLAAVLDRLITGPDRNAIVRLENALHDSIPTLRGIALRTVDGRTGAKTLEFVLDVGAAKGPLVTIPCAHASDGEMLLTAFLALASSDEPVLLLIEEPENGLHPSRLQSVVEMLRKISEGALGNQPRQVIVTTQSPLLLNYTRPEEVRIVQRDREKGTSVTPMSEVRDVYKLLEEFGTGELWYLLGEQGLVEGKKP